MSRHTYREDPGQVTVAELIDKLTTEGVPIRLAWSAAELNSQVTRDMRDWPTGVLPVVPGTELPKNFGTSRR
jgi:hypothetical protein